MSKQEDGFVGPEGAGEEFVPAMFARSQAEAERYRDLLEDHDIPAMVGTEDLREPSAATARVGSMTHGVEVLVPEALLDEASEVIADREDLDEFASADEDIEEDEEDEEDELSAEDGDEDLDEEDEGFLGGLDDDEDEDEKLGF